MSLRPKLNEHRMTVYAPGVRESRSASGLRMRIGGPVANELCAVTRGRNLALAARALAWMPFVVLAIFAARILLVLPGPLLWIGLAIYLACQAFSLAVDFVLGRAIFRDPKRCVVPLIAVVLAVESATSDPTLAILIALPIAVGASSYASHIIATEYAMWLAEDLRLGWDERDERRERWQDVRPLGVAVQIGILLALGAYFIAARESPLHLAGLVAILLLSLYLTSLVIACGPGPRAAVTACWEAVIVWFSYNRHGWSGPQTFQFAPEWRDPRSRTALALGTTAVVAVAVVGATFDAPTYEETSYGSVFNRVLSGLPGEERLDSLTDVAPVFAPTPEQELFLEQLPETERATYLASLKAAARQERRQTTGGISTIDWIISSLIRVLLLLPIPIVLIAIVFVGEFGPVLAELSDGLGAGDD